MINESLFDPEEAQSDISSLSKGINTPREYQIFGARFLAGRSGAILADDMGSGKTGSAITAWKLLSQKGPVLLIARPNTQSVWIKQAPQWGVQTPYIISGTKKQRTKEWDEVDQYSFVACTIESINRDIKDTRLSKINWELIIVEEAHKFVNRKISHFRTLKELRKRNKHIIFITGSPMRKGFEDLWTLLHLCDHKRWSSYWRYVQTFGYTQVNEYGAWEVLGLKEKQAHAKAIAPYFLRRTMEEVAPEVPKKTRILDHVLEMTSLQSKMYDKLNSEMILELPNDKLVVAQNVLVKLVKLRQILCSPKIINPECPEWGASLQHLGELLEEADALSKEHIVIFAPFVAATEIAKDFLIREFSYKEEKVHILKGGIKPEELNRKTSQFAAEGGATICTVDFAESFDLVPARWAYFLGFEWNPFKNLQAEDRLRRLITTYPTFFYYPTHRGCIDQELILQACNTKGEEALKVYNSSAAHLRHLLERRYQANPQLTLTTN